MKRNEKDPWEFSAPLFFEAHVELLMAEERRMIAPFLEAFDVSFIIIISIIIAISFYVYWKIKGEMSSWLDSKR